jgi:hypothetical protein
VVRNIFTVIPHGFGVQDRFFLVQDVLGWRQLKTPDETRDEKLIVRQFTRTNNGILACSVPALNNTNTENDLEMTKEAEKLTLHRMAKISDILEVWQGSENISPTQKKARPQNWRMPAMESISDAEEIINAS